VDNVSAGRAYSLRSLHKILSGPQDPQWKSARHGSANLVAEITILFAEAYDFSLIEHFCLLLINTHGCGRTSGKLNVDGVHQLYMHLNSRHATLRWTRAISINAMGMNDMRRYFGLIRSNFLFLIWGQGHVHAQFLFTLDDITVALSACQLWHIKSYK